ncbi:MAG: glycosyltransferase family 2 protein [Balneolaceae bacterium]
MQRKYSIIIVTWNALHHIKTFLPSVVATDYVDFEIIIANNASTDGTAEWVSKHFPDIKIVTFSKNHGYCGGNNRAADYAKGDILVFLNNDVWVEKEWLMHLDKAFDNKTVAAAQPKMRSHTKPEYFEYAGAAGGFLDRLCYPFCRGRIFDTVEKDNGQYDQPGEIFWASGAALGIRKDIFVEMGKFDEDFEFHMEEIDLCWRLWNNGFKVVYRPDSVVYHLGGGSLPMGSSRKVFYNYRNNLIMMLKNLQSKGLLFRILLRLELDGIAGVRSLLQLKPGETWAIIRAHFAFYGKLIKTIHKRKKLQKQRKTESDPPVLYTRIVAMEYFLKKKRTFSELSDR